MENFKIGIRFFIEQPYMAYVHGYRPTYMDCVAVYANDLSRSLLLPFIIWRDYKEIMDMSIRDLLVLILATPVALIMPFIYPSAIWFLGFRLKKKLPAYLCERKMKLNAMINPNQREDSCTN